jgi:hypothetical protein
VSELWVRPFVLLTTAIALSVFGMVKHLNRIRSTKKMDDPPQEELGALLAGGIWYGWMTYGVVFGDVPPVVVGAWAYVHGIVVALLVMVSHSHANARRDGACATVLLVAVVLLLFLPHPDTISRHIEPTALFTKILAFYVLFAVVEVAHKLDFEARTRIGDGPTPAQRVYAVQVQVVQTAWVLLTIIPLIPIAVMQIFILGVEIHGHLRDRRNAHLISATTTTISARLPLRSSDLATPPHQRLIDGGGGERRRRIQPPPPPPPAPKQEQQQRQRFRQPPDDGLRRAAAAPARTRPPPNLHDIPADNVVSLRLPASSTAVVAPDKAIAEMEDMMFGSVR